MASALLSVADLKIALNDTATSVDGDKRYERLIDDVQAIFEAEVGRSRRPFAGAQTGRIEVHDGNGDVELLLDYPVGALTSVLVGADTAEPDETLDISDKQVLRYGVGQHRLMRVDGGVFGCDGDPRVVHVTYDAAADLPQKAKAAVIAGCKVLVARWGAEGVAAERIGAYSIDYANFVTSDMANDPIWKMGVEACMERIV